MSVPDNRRLRRAGVLLLTVVVVLATVSPVVAAGASTALVAGVDGEQPASPLTTQVETENTTTAPTQTTETVVVRLREADISRDASRATVIETLKSHAERTQPSVLAFARNQSGVTVAARFWLTNAVVLRYDTDKISADSIRSLEGVDRVHPNFRVTVPGPNVTNTTTRSDADDPRPTVDPATYGLEQVNAPATWETFDTRGGGVKVAVLDSGVNASHPDIDLFSRDPGDPTYPGGWAEFDGFGRRVTGSVPHDPVGHGTHVSGTVAGGNASGQYVGVAPNVTLLHGLVLSPDGGFGSGTFAQIIAGLQWAVAESADIASMSLSTSGPAVEWIGPVRNAIAAETVVVAAIGNDGLGTSGSPANVFESIAVGATDANEAVATISGGDQLVTLTDWAGNAPPEWPSTYIVPDVSAPGVAVVSTSTDGGYETLSGTSMATPHVAGVIALMQSASPRALSVTEITAALYNTVRKPPTASPEQDTRYGLGIVDALEATRQVSTPDCVAGDANRDGQVTALDATLIQRTIVGLPVDGLFDAVCADISGDSRLTPLDVTLVLQTIAGFPAEGDAPENSVVGQPVSESPDHSQESETANGSTRSTTPSKSSSKLIT